MSDYLWRGQRPTELSEAELTEMLDYLEEENRLRPGPVYRQPKQSPGKNTASLF